MLIVPENTIKHWVFVLLHSIWFDCDVADLKAQLSCFRELKRNFNVTLDAFTKKSHVYSGAMTCS